MSVLIWTDIVPESIFGRVPESIFDRVSESIFDRVPESIFDKITLKKVSRQQKHAKLSMECSG